jgi:hypothetical protein
MTIEFHCNHCDELVRTADENAGKRGKCPRCHQSVYIPTPPDKIEPLRLAPVDETEEEERRRLQRESQELSRDLQSEQAETPPDSGTSSMSAPPPFDDPRLPSDMETLVTDYALYMAEGKLNEAQSLATEIRRDMDRAEEFIQRITIDELPPARLAHIPRPVLQGFMKQLRSS